MKITELAEQTTKEFTKVYERFAAIDERFDRVDERFSEVDARFDRMEAYLAEMHSELIQRMDRMDARFLSLYDLLDGFAKKFSNVSQEVVVLGSQVSRNERRLEGVAKHVGYSFES